MRAGRAPGNRLADRALARANEFPGIHHARQNGIALSYAISNCLEPIGGSGPSSTTYPLVWAQKQGPGHKSSGPETIWHQASFVTEL